MSQQLIDKIEQQNIAELREAQKAYDDARIKDAKQILQSIIELYSNNQDVTGLVDRAQQQLDAINKA